MTFTAENILLIGAILIFCSILISKTGYRFGIPTLLLFLLVGMGFGSDGLGLQFDSAIDAQFIGMIALSIILFTGGMDTKLTDIRPVLTQGILLSTVGVLLTTLLTGGFIYYLSQWTSTNISMSFLTCLLLAATMSSTDSASVFNLLRSQKMNLKENLRPMLELESGSNDPMAYILTVMLVGIATGTDGINWANAVGTFVVQMVVGAALGYGFGRATVWIMNRINIRSNPSLYSVLLLASAFFTYSFTTIAYGNGYLAVYIAGLVVGNFRIVFRNMLSTFFDSFTLLLQIILFLLLGLMVNIDELMQPNVYLMALAIGAFMIIVARPISTLICMAPFRQFSKRARVYASWVGLRGAVPIIFALYTVTHGVEGSEYIFNVVFLVTIISLLVQGTTVSSMANWLKLSYAEPQRTFKLTVPDHIRSDFSEIEVNEALLARGDTLKDIRLPGHTLVVMVYRNEKYFVPKGLTQLLVGDKLLVVSDNNDELLQKIKDMGIENVMKV